MPIWSLSTGQFDVQVVTPGALDPTLKAVVDLLKALGALNAAVPVAFCKVDRDVADVTRYTYRIDLKDGRKWRQVLFFPAGGEPTMTFNVADQWALSEFAPHRAIRDLTIALVQQHGATKIHATWA
jgi:hypothetical protein